MALSDTESDNDADAQAQQAEQQAAQQAVPVRFQLVSHGLWVKVTPPAATDGDEAAARALMEFNPPGRGLQAQFENVQLSSPVGSKRSQAAAGLSADRLPLLRKPPPPQMRRPPKEWVATEDELLRAEVDRRGHVEDAEVR